MKQAHKGQIWSPTLGKEESARACFNVIALGLVHALFSKLLRSQWEGVSLVRRVEGPSRLRKGQFPFLRNLIAVAATHAHRGGEEGRKEEGGDAYTA